MSIEKHQSLDILGPSKFLLTCSELDLDNFELSTLGNLANLKSQAPRAAQFGLRRHRPKKRPERRDCKTVRDDSGCGVRALI